MALIITQSEIGIPLETVKWTVAKLKDDKFFNLKLQFYGIPKFAVRLRTDQVKSIKAAS